MRQSKHRRHSVRGYFGEYNMENFNTAPIADNFMDALVAERDAFRIERDEMKAKLARSERDANLLREQRGMWIAIMADPIREMVKKEFADMMADFDIADYTDEIKEIAADGFDIGDYEDDIRDSVDFTASDYTTEIGDVVRDILRDSIIKLEV
tara:strand:- start:359 stop:817 length:459 start_codon:yes stop_codon:yes gene_type:complete